MWHQLSIYVQFSWLISMIHSLNFPWYTHWLGVSSFADNPPSWQTLSDNHMFAVNIVTDWWHAACRSVFLGILRLFRAKGKWDVRKAISLHQLYELICLADLYSGSCYEAQLMKAIYVVMFTDMLRISEMFPLKNSHHQVLFHNTKLGATGQVLTSNLLLGSTQMAELRLWILKMASCLTPPFALLWYWEIISMYALG